MPKIEEKKKNIPAESHFFWISLIIAMYFMAFYYCIKNFMQAFYYYYCRPFFRAEKIEEIKNNLISKTKKTKFDR